MVMSGDNNSRSFCCAPSGANLVFLMIPGGDRIEFSIN